MGSGRIAVIGAGAIGGALAAAMHAAGHQVTLCVRSPFEKLVVETSQGAATIPATITSEPAEVGKVDWVLLATKVQDVGGAAPWLHAFDDGETPIVLVQNGIEHLETVASLRLRAPLVRALTYVGAERIRPGYTVQRSGLKLIVPVGDLAADLGDLFDGSGAEVAATRDFGTQAWRKLLTNLTANPITALTLRRLDVFADAGIRELAEGVLTEAIAVGRASGADLTNADADWVLEAFSDGYSPENGTSMLYDRLAGVATEHEHITGALVRAAKRADVPTPLNTALLALMRAIRPEAIPG